MTDELYNKLISQMGNYCIYLRKSRADLDAEARGEGETLARHERALFDLASRLKLNITKVYREIVSGETIAQRPVIQHLLREIEEGLWTGVLVMEIERLARGDTIDQGIIAQTFKYSQTKIITPVKTYDPDNEFDEEYFEFGLFMSRREYKTINRRQQRGRIDSVREGNFVGNIPPYGYDKAKLENEKGNTLVPNPEQAPIVKMIFDLYTSGGIGMGLIAKKLNEMGVPTAKNSVWTITTINGIIRNPVYKGKIAWNRRKEKKSRKLGAITKSRPRAPQEEWILVDGKHEALVSEEIWDKAHQILKNRNHPATPRGIIASSLAGIVVCEVCGRRMVRRPYARNQAPTLVCNTPMCTNVSAPLHMVEKRILEGLAKWLEDYRAEWDNNKPQDSSNEDVLKTKELLVKNAKEALVELQKQQSSLHDLLEKKVYTVEVFLERSQNISTRIQEGEEKLKKTQAELDLELKRNEAKKDIIPKCEKVLDVYDKTEDPAKKNELLKTVLELALYKKTVRGHWSRPETIDDFDIKLFPKLPNT
ncbi:recombinase family protein [Paenibacillus sp. S29]|uniref:recombinase family protein n=1 Tax=Paenibacillus sp. S29 TaxID=3394611 RepID=UPI0039BF9305